MFCKEIAVRSDKGERRQMKTDMKADQGERQQMKTDMRECHLFDADREYRMIWRESQGDSIELVLSREDEKQMDPDLLYTQRVLVQEQFSKEKDLPDHLVIVNRYEYSENDALMLKNYRISV